MVTAPQCCSIGCDQSAEYSIWSPPDPNDVTEACTAHVGALLSDSRCEVWPLAANTLVRGEDGLEHGPSCRLLDMSRVPRFCTCGANLPIPPAPEGAVLDAATVLQRHTPFRTAPPTTCTLCFLPWHGGPETGGCDAHSLARRVVELEGALGDLLDLVEVWDLPKAEPRSLTRRLYAQGVAILGDRPAPAVREGE